MTGIIALKEIAHNTTLRFRSIDNILSKPEFDRMWDAADNEKRLEITEHVTEGNREALIELIRDYASKELGELPYRELRAMARQRGVPYYSQLTKVELIRKLQYDNQG